MKTMELNGVKEVYPHNNENSLILKFWNGAEIVVDSRCGFGITKDQRVLLYEE